MHNELDHRSEGAGHMRQDQVPEFLKVLAHDLRWKLLTRLSRSDYRVQELIAFLEEPQNLVSYHLKRLRDLYLVT
ncbi:ArsR family transcriptional regulator, partial [Klebsiella pneumoniae]|uniref:ArsR/SmtB family transcription factor n=1 Tax=Klebsiella pneumoniae TaxID=573 RepID=UPI003013365C